MVYVSALILTISLACVSAGGEVHGPHIDLLGLESGQTVYLREMFLDGYIQDEAGVADLRIQGKSIDVATGTPVYFGHIVRLEDGTNTIEISATNLKGITTSKSLVLHCVSPPAFPSQPDKLVITIPSFDVLGNGNGKEISEVLRSGLSNTLMDRGRFTVVTDNELSSILLERKLGSDDLIDTRYRVADRSSVTADLVFDGQLILKGNGASLYLRAVRAQDGSILTVLETHAAGRGPESLKKMAEAIGLKLEREFPLVEGEIFNLTPRVLCSLTSKEGIRLGSEVKVFRRGEEVILPSGRSAGFDFQDIGTMTVIRATDEFCELAPDDKLVENPQVGDRVVTR